MEQTRVTPATPGAEAESVISREDTLDGQLKTVTGVRVLGTVRGGIESQRTVRIESGAHVEADITAAEVVIAGTYSGTLTCRDRLEITSTGRVTGKIHTAKMQLHEGGFFDGELQMSQTPKETPRPSDSDSVRLRRPRYTEPAAEATPSAEQATEVGTSGEAPAS
jgi:cytoskeletal protein CcmA (bactofilin family)